MKSATPDDADREAPAGALRLAAWFIDARVREVIVGDLVEQFAAARPDKATRGALRRRFWREVIVAITKFPRRPRLSHPIGDGHVSGFLQDLARAVRTLRRAPAFTLACAITLALGIGSATSIFSVADPLLIRSLPYRDAGRLFITGERDASGQGTNLGFATFADLRDQARSIEHAAAVGSWSPTLVRNGSAEQLNGLRVSASYFATIGVHPALGRDFSADEDDPSRNTVIIMSHALWRERFSADSAIVGKTVNIGGASMLVAGVMPADYDDVLRPGAQVWRVLGYRADLPFACRTCRHLRMVTRLRAGVDLKVAAAEFDVLSANMMRDHPHDYPAVGLTLSPLQATVARRVKPALVALLVAVSLLLVIAAVNVGGLQLARAMLREEEFAVRTALGAARWRLTRMLLAEGLVLAFLAGIGGWFIARLGVAALVQRLPAMPRLSAVHLDARAGALALLVTAIGGLAIGMIPAWHATRRSLASSMRGTKTVNRAPQRVRAMLVVTEVALAVILLCGAGLLARSLARVLSTDPGIDLATVANAQVQVSGPRYADNAAVWAWQDKIVDLSSTLGS